MPADGQHLRQAALNMVRVVQRHFGSDLSIGLLRDRLGCQPWIPPPSWAWVRLGVFALLSLRIGHNMLVSLVHTKIDYIEFSITQCCVQLPVRGQGVRT